MGKCVSCNFDPCECCGDDFTIPSAASHAQSLIGSLGPCVDQLRDLEVCLGARSKVVRLVWTRWTDGRRGAGQEIVEREEILTPVPEVKSISDLTIELQSIGNADVGVVQVSKISTRYTENFLMGRDLDGTPIRKDQNFYWEIEEPDGHGGTIRRRFTPKGPPDLKEVEFQWVIKLTKQHQNRTARSEPRG